LKKGEYEMKTLFICASLLSLWSESAISVTFENQTNERIDFKKNSWDTNNLFILGQKQTVEKNLLSEIKAEHDNLQKNGANLGSISFAIKAKSAYHSYNCTLRIGSHYTSDELEKLNETHFIIQRGSGHYNEGELFCFVKGL
jgi:hypothetical protein